VPQRSRSSESGARRQRALMFSTRSARSLRGVKPRGTFGFLLKSSACLP